jgi:hypothetical protein
MIRKPREGTKAEAILTLTTTTPATVTEIAESVNCSKSNVSQVLARYNIEPNAVESYKNHRADVFAGIQERVIQSITDKDVNTATLSARAALLGVLYDKERLERGLSTANVALATMSEEDIDAELAAIRQRLDNIIDITPCETQSISMLSSNTGVKQDDTNTIDNDK